MGRRLVCACVHVRMRLLFPLIRRLSGNWRCTDPHTDPQIPQPMTALPLPANKNLSLSLSLSLCVLLSFFSLFHVLYFCRLDVGVEVRRSGERR